MKVQNRGGRRYANGGYGSILQGAGAIAGSMGPDDPAASTLGTTLQFAGYGSALGPVGAAVGGLVGFGVGALNAKKAKDAQRKAEVTEFNLKKQQKDIRSKGILNTYDTEGSNVNTYYAYGGVERPLSSNAVEMDGRTHEEGGIKMGKVEVEDDEVGVDFGDTRIWFSDRLKGANGKTFAKQAKSIGREQGRAEKKIEGGDRYATGTGQRQHQIAQQKMTELADEQFETQIKQGIDPYGEVAAMGAIELPQAAYSIAGLLQERPELGLGVPERLPAVGINRPFVKNIDRLPTSMPEVRSQRITGGEAAMLQTKPEYADPKVASQSVDNRNFTPNLDNVGEAITPFIDNIVNANLTRNTPRPPSPTMRRNVPLETDFDISAPLAELRRTTGNTYESIDKSTSNSSIGRANKLAAHAQSVNASNNLYTTKANAETNLTNQDRLNVQQIGNTNLGLIDKYREMNFLREGEKQERTSANVANLVEDLRLMQKNNNQKRVDAAEIELIKKRFSDTGVYDRTIDENLEKLAKGDITLDQFIKLVEKPK